MTLTPNPTRPYVISWNLTNRCNLQCEHCYLDAGAEQYRKLDSDGFSDRSELGTEECFAIIDQIAEFAPECVTILTGGEPLLRQDILDIIQYGAQKNLWVVCGSNGVFITHKLAKILKENGLRGMALSLDSLDPKSHDNFRGVKGAWDNTVNGATALNDVNLPFIVQTTVTKQNFNQISKIADFAHETMSAKVFNLYFLVSTGRGQFVSDLSSDQYNRVLENLMVIQEKYDGRMLINAKCAPHYSRILYESGADSGLLKTFSSGAGGCPAGMQYMGIRPNGDMTPCPYLPVFGGNLKNEKIENIWNESELFKKIRNREDLENRCGECEFAGVCGGCRARAWGTTGNYMQEDELCDYPTGNYSMDSIQDRFQVEYGLQFSSEKEDNRDNSNGANSEPNMDGQQNKLTWENEAMESMKKIPVFVRGMVQKRIETYCDKNQIDRVTPKVLSEIRSKMPTKNLFKS